MTTTSRFRLSMSEEEMIASIKRAIEETVKVRGFTYSSLGSEDERINALLARFLLRRDYHTGFMFWGKPGTGKTIRMKSVYALIESFFETIPVLGYSVKYQIADDLVYPYATIESLQKLYAVDLLILDNLGYERGAGENIRLAQSLIGELLLKRYDAVRPTVISSVFDIDNIGEVYGSRVADIIRESYYVMELTTDFRSEIIKARKSNNFQNYEN
ncbi:hypothetical protein [Bacteroides acidifaciens]|uniref:hypothetical protein n=1 Tax=Bacteroides acidifaciens TaxID=85831 RepID=UPI00261A8B9E|nr:hypothetical protein [Bacteroides acidifaciens]